MTPAFQAALGTSICATVVMILGLIRTWTTKLDDEHGDALVLIWTMVMLGFFASWVLLEIG
jgi:hypothetical protein